MRLPRTYGAGLSMHTHRTQPATLEPVRFGEFLRDRSLISEEQWIAALATHWSAATRRRIGDTIVAEGFLAASTVEAELRTFHDELEVVEIGEAGEVGEVGAIDDRRGESAMPRSERTTLPVASRGHLAPLSP